jgi:hypothetical protein
LGARCGSMVVERKEPATHGRHSRSRVLAEPGAESAPVAERPTRASRHTAISSAGSAGSPSALPEGLPALAVGTGLHVLAAIVDDDVAAACDHEVVTTGIGRRCGMPAARTGDVGRAACGSPRSAPGGRRTAIDPVGSA